MEDLRKLLAPLGLSPDHVQREHPVQTCLADAVVLQAKSRLGK